MHKATLTEERGVGLYIRDYSKQERSRAVYKGLFQAREE